MGKKIQDFLTNNNHFPIDHPNYRRAVLLNCVIVIIIFISTVFSIMNFLIGKGPDIVVVELVAAILMCLNGYYFQKYKKLELTSLLTTVFTITYVTYLFINIGLRADFITWILILPLLFFFLLKRKTALILSLVYMLVICYLLLNKYFNTQNDIDLRTFVNYIGAALVFNVFIFYFERSGWIIANELKIKNRVLKKLAEIDTLTGLYNRYVINMHIEKVLKNQTAFSVIMIDIDDFKSINDRFGHFIGDRVLAEVGLVLQTFSNKDILCGRWGGEEFLIICNNKNVTEAYELAEEIRTKLVSSAFLNGEGIPTSMGVAEHNGDEEPINTISRADDALYIAKGSGKFRVESCKNCTKV